MIPLAQDHCSGCGESGHLPDGPIFDRRDVQSKGLLTVVSAINWPDARTRYLCVKCPGKFDRHAQRLSKFSTGWGHLT
jgi:hypothetical protein